MTRARKAVGRITFVGAGPGDPGLLTTNAADAIRGADVIVTDTAVPAAVTSLASVELRASEAAPADTVKSMLAEARNGLNVVRIVAGDVFDTDPVVKEALAVARTAVPFDVVPGIGLGAGTATYAGVAVGPVRTVADLRDAVAADFEALAHAAGTLVLTVDAAEVQNVGEQLVA